MSVTMSDDKYNYMIKSIDDAKRQLTDANEAILEMLKQDSANGWDNNIAREYVEKYGVGK